MCNARVRLQTAEFEVRYEGSTEFFERVIAPLFTSWEGRGRGSDERTRPVREAPPAARRPRAGSSGYRPPLDRFGTFRRRLDPTKEGTANRVAAYAFFLWNYEKKEVFKEDEVEGCFRADELPLPEDPATVYGDLLTRRMLAPGAAERSWRLTSKGVDYVRHHLLSA
ncbi:MAG: hypothetical protein ACC662_06145 [Planctomycetota bacterium]